MQDQEIPASCADESICQIDVASSRITSPGITEEAEQLTRQIRELEDDNVFLRKSNEGLHKEVEELNDVIRQNAIAHRDLQSAYTTLQKSFKKLEEKTAKEAQCLTTKLQETRDKLKQLPITKFTQAKKPYHDLKQAQRAVVNREIREMFAPEIDNTLKKRKLSVGQLILKETEGQKADVRINVQPTHTFESLTQAEKDKLALICDAKVIHRMSHSAYAATRRIIPDMPPFTHVKQYEEQIISKFPPLTDAPGRPGAFFELRHEISCQIEYLHKLGKLNLAEPIYIKPGIDATKLNSASVCVYSIETISTATEIGIAGAVVGGDGYEDMQLTAHPFLEQVKELAKNPVINTSIGDIEVKLRVGGDLANMLELLGLCKACSRNPCPICVIAKEEFASAATNPSHRTACNTILRRTIANISNIAIQSKAQYGVKRLPLLPIPLNPDDPIGKTILLCILHARKRLTGRDFLTPFHFNSLCPLLRWDNAAV